MDTGKTVESVKKMNYKIIGSTLVGGVLVLFLLRCTFYMATTPVETALNLAILILGVACGWLFGILISPYSSKEQEEFSVYTKAVGAFVSGYLVGKVDKVIEALFKPEFILDSVHGFRILAFVSIFIISMLLTFCYRKYVT